MKSPAERIRALPVLLQDASLAVVITVVDIELFSTAVIPGPAMALYAASGAAILAWRRRAPVAVFGLTWVHNLLQFLVSDYSPLLGLMLALFTLAARTVLRAALVALVLAYTANVAAVLREFLALPEQNPVLLVVMLTYYFMWFTGAWGTGRWARVSRLRIAELDFLRRAEAFQAVIDERMRIARELHDVVAHSVTMMLLQAANARKLLAGDQPQAGRMLAQVDEFGQETMEQLRNMLVVLRADGTGDEDAGGLGLDDVATLLDGVRRAGLPVTLDAGGDLGRLDPAVGLAAYRIVQEALTNVSKHAGPDAHARVELSRVGERLCVQVSNDVSGAARAGARPAPGGHGLIGLRERAAAVGGTLESGPTPSGGFRVRALLPLARQPAMPS
ncbi:sensor histidine kinase [Nonomuraea monospora]|uniref:histidine kinase n=1 Tax=Nonomuraea monospora TaxID=568818 RepID=A0ABP5PC00_9ACTN